MIKIVLAFVLLLSAHHAISQEVKTNAEWVSLIKKSIDNGDVDAFVNISQSRWKNSSTVSCYRIRKNYFLISMSNNDILRVEPVSDSLFQLLNKGFGHVRAVNREMQKPGHAKTLQKNIEDSGNPDVLYINFAVKNKSIHNGHIRLLSEESIAALPNAKLKAAYNWLNLFAKAMYETQAITFM